MSHHPTVITLSSDVTVATFANVVVSHFRGETPPSCLASLRRAMQSLTDERVVFFGVIDIASAPPGEEARRGFTAFFEDSAPRLSCAIVTYRGEGFRGAMVRAIVSGIMNVAPRLRLGFPKHVVASVEEATSLAQRYSPALDGTALRRALRAVEDMRPDGVAASASR